MMSGCNHNFSNCFLALVKTSNIYDPDLIAINQNGQDKTIAYRDFISSLGVTGAIAQAGSNTATPVLDTQGTVNNIRNIEDGPGIKSSVSPENGITLEHNILSGTGGVPVFKDSTELQPTIRSIVAGSGISVSATNGSIQIATSGTGPVTNTVVVTSVADLPSPVSGVIQLEDETSYRFDALVDISPNRLKSGTNTVLFSTNRLDWGVITNNSGALLSNDIAFFATLCLDIRLDSTGGSIFSFTNGSVPIIQNSATIESQAPSVFDSTNQCQIFNYSIFAFGTTVHGIKFTGSCTELVMDSGVYTGWTGNLIDLSAATFSQGIILGPNMRMTTASGNTALKAAPATLGAGTTALIHSNKFIGGGTYLDGVDSKTDGFNFVNNDGVKDTTVDALLSLQSNATNTVIAVTGTPVKAAGTWVVEDENQMTGDTTGRITLDAAKDYHRQVTASVSIAPVSGGNQQMAAYIAVNGVTVANSKRTATAASGSPSSITIPWDVDLSTGDYVEVWVANDTGTTDILVSSAVLRVS